MTDAVRREFEEWFDSEYPADENGSREKYRDSNVMQLMQAAYAAGQAAAEEKLRDYNSAGDILAEITGCYDQNIALWELADRAREIIAAGRADKEKEVERLTDEIAMLKAERDAYREGMRRVKLDLEEEQEDTKRLDWLDEVTRKTNERNGTVYGWRFDINHNRAALMDHNWPALSIRQAIDAAMNKEEKNG